MAAALSASSVFSRVWSRRALEHSAALCPTWRRESRLRRLRGSRKAAQLGSRTARPRPDVLAATIQVASSPGRHLGYRVLEWDDSKNPLFS